MVRDKREVGGRLFSGANTGSVGDSIEEYVVRCTINRAHLDTPVLQRENGLCSGRSRRRE